jgi:hypothetical protein
LYNLPETIEKNVIKRLPVKKGDAETSPLILGFKSHPRPSIIMPHSRSFFLDENEVVFVRSVSCKHGIPGRISPAAFALPGGFVV